MERSRVQLVPRASCTDDSAPGCTKPTQTPTIAIVVAVLVPVILAAVVLLYLHRRNIKKLREEDAKDKYKSYDFGVDPAVAGGKKKKGGNVPEMSLADAEKSIRHERGISMDITGPYIMPGGLNASRESFHSLSRSLNDPHDPYRPVTFIKGDGNSVRSGSRTGRYPNENGSMYTSSSGATDSRDRMGSSLLRNAQRMSQSYPPRGESMSPERQAAPEIKFPEPVAAPLQPNAVLPPPPPPPPAARIESTPPVPQNAYVAFKPMDPPATPAPAAQPQSTEQPPVQESKAAMRTTPSPPPRIQSQEAVVQGNANTTSFMSDSSYGSGFKVTPPSPPRHERVLSDQGPVAPEPLRHHPDPQQPAGLGVDEFGGNLNRLSMSLRPLPPDDPNDNPEQRANRIRSFYKEYFDDSKPEPAGGHSYNDYYEDYGTEYLDGTLFDPETGAFVVAQPSKPYAAPVTRRAMTPPPRAPPRFRSGSMPRGPHMSNSSMASSRYIPPRGMSSMSGRAPAPRKPLPPPSVLSSLPTPAKLTENSMVFDPIDFAPPVSFRERQNGMRPDSPLGSPRPYSPAVRPHTPLASSFDDLAVMPSPHMLRKSGTFTALDFAPPPRFRDPGSNASDAGSIRSNRSGMSAAGSWAVRNGAYRVSRIPKEVAGTRDDIAHALRPQMNMVAPA